jgi:hypothetical protein
MGQALTREELEAAHCWWESADRVPGRPAMTEFRQRLRYHQALWREAKGHPIGTQPLAPRPVDKNVVPIGSRFPLDYAKDTGANFLTKNALQAARERTAFIEPHQSFDHQRLWADLLSAMAMSFNLFGDLAADLELANRAVRAWWPDTPGKVTQVRFAHSPGRFDMDYLGNLSDFEAAFVLDMGDGRMGVVAINANYHERIKPETPKPIRAAHYGGIGKKSGVFAPGAIDRQLNRRSDLLEMWLRHLLLLSMLQYPSGIWAWGRYVVLHPAESPDFVEATERYRGLLVDDSTYGTMTIEDLLDSGVFPQRSTSALRRRYIPRS